MNETRNKNLIKTPAFMRLEDLAISASYKQLVSWLDQLRDLQKPKEGAPIPPNSHDGPFSPRQECAIKSIRDYLDHYLVGVAGDKARSKYVEHMYEKFRQFQMTQPKHARRFFESLGGKAKVKQLVSKKTAINMPLFLAFILNDGIEELKIPVTFQYLDLNPGVMAVVAEKAPNLKKLKLNLSRIKKDTRYKETIPLITSLSPLVHLTHLSLYYLSNSNRLILQSLGKSCPSLSYLKVSRQGFRLEAMDVEGIVLGELAGDLLLESKECLLQVPPELLTPLCHSLRHLHLSNLTFNRYYHSVIFALLHLPNLEKMDGDFTCMAVKILHDFYAKGKEEKLKEFQAKCREIANRNKDPAQNLAPILNPTFSGTLSLVRLDVAPAMNAEVLRVIGATCPNLKEVRFWDHLPRTSQGESSVAEVESALAKWPQLENIAILDVPWKYVQVIMKIFGPKLKQLAFERCQNVNLFELSSFEQLETLRILDETKLKKIPANQPTLSADVFLPKLTNLECEICMGPYWAHFFEQKSGLTRVALNCFHIGTKGSSCADWNSFPLMWPALHYLHILECDGLNLSNLPNIVHRLGGLKEISVPDRTRWKQKKLLPSILNDFCNRPSPIDIRFISENQEACPFLKHLKEFESSESESSAAEDDGGDVEMSGDGEEEDEGDYEEEDGGNVDDEGYVVDEDDGMDVDDEDDEVDEADEELNQRCAFSDSDSDESF